MENSRRTKIVATIGPASANEKVLAELFQAGVNVVRLNMSHAGHDYHRRSIHMAREVSGRSKDPVAILMDLQGPRIRTGFLKDKSIELAPGQKIIITTDDAPGEGNIIPTTYKDLYRDVSPGDRILMDEGLIEARVIELKGTAIEAQIIYGGTLKEHKGINLPGVRISAPSLSEKDLSDVDFGIAEGVDAIALSFVREAADIFRLREHIKAKGADIPIIAKIERPEAIENLESVLDASDGIMIARGDLGVELSAEDVPVLQKKLISKANEAGKLVITATQMLESMISNPRPTRAEASDIANAVFDGTDALMLSGETAIGKYPVQAVSTMSRIAKEAEEAAMAQKYLLRRKEVGTFTQAVAYAAYAASNEVNSKAIVVFTQTGYTARILSKLRPSAPIIAFTPIDKTCRLLSLAWGVRPFCAESGANTDEMICRGESVLLDNGIAEYGDPVVIVSGTKVGMRGATNMMKIDWIGSDECKLFEKKNGK